MKQLVVISGKGGTGKTVVTGALAALAQNKVLVDCDVDAADLHLLLQPTVKETHDFKSGRTAVIDPGLCNHCDKCREVCRFGAITSDHKIEHFSCEGCALCHHLCPAQAIRMTENLAGQWFVSETRYGPFVHAKLGIAEENSGKLVARIRQVARDLAKKETLDWIIIDGPPGIGCPVIASLTGVDQALIVTEPTLSGLHDASRVIDLAGHFKVPVSLVINKYDLNLEISGQIERYCLDQGIPVIGKLPFNREVVDSMIQGKTIIEYPNCPLKEELTRIWSIIE
jgi:MinD superfamily P-loop ATPase